MHQYKCPQIPRGIFYSINKMQLHIFVTIGYIKILILHFTYLSQKIFQAVFPQKRQYCVKYNTAKTKRQHHTPEGIPRKAK